MTAGVITLGCVAIVATLARVLVTRFAKRNRVYPRSTETLTVLLERASERADQDRDLARRQGTAWAWRDARDRAVRRLRADRTDVPTDDVTSDGTSDTASWSFIRAETETVRRASTERDT